MFYILKITEVIMSKTVIHEILATTVRARGDLRKRINPYSYYQSKII